MTRLQEFKHWKIGQKFLQVKYPLISGAMTWISNSRLVRAVSEAGGFGTLAAGNLPIEELVGEIKNLKYHRCNFGVNLITIAPNYQDHLKNCLKMAVPYIIFAGSFPRKQEIELAKKSAAKVICFASTESIAQRMIDYGADALILEGSEAGGHIGYVSTLVLLQQVLFKFTEIPIFVAGGIATGKLIAHLFLMGTAGIQMGTIFALSVESPAHRKFKDRYLKARAREAYATPQYDSSLPIVAVRGIKNQGTEEFGKLQLKLLNMLKKGEISRVTAQFEVEKYWSGSLKRAVQNGDINFGSLMAGQSVGLIDRIKPVKKIMADLLSEAEKEFTKIKNLLDNQIKLPKPENPIL